jgi:DNA-directed RNA polymerase subunit M/transcription elongation factor TFIIS
MEGIMAKYSTDSGSSGSAGDDSGGHTKQISVAVSDWLKDALNKIVRQSDASAREAIRRPLEYAVIQWNLNFEQDNEAFDIPGEHVWESDFRCIECKSANKFLFREVQREDGDSDILCLNCDRTMSESEVTRLAEAARIQEMEPYALEKEGTKIRHEYEGQFRTPMRFGCKECKERDLILPDPNKIEALICPRCGNKGEILNQIRGPVPKGFEKYPPDKYHSEPSPGAVGRGVSRGKYGEL